MLSQCKRVAGPVDVVVLDGNYCNGTVMGAAVRQDVAVVCRPKSPKQRKEKRKAFAKADFRYDSEQDVYICPAHQQMRAFGKGRKGSSSFIRYAASISQCKSCPLRGQCLLRGQRRRTIDRFETDEFREALLISNSHSQTSMWMKRRKAMIEPVFSELRELQGLVRFRRRGLAGAQVEFALHATAHNIRRMIVLLARRAGGSSLLAGIRSLFLLALAMLLLPVRIVPVALDRRMEAVAA